MHQLIEIGPENFPVFAEEILCIERASFSSPWSIAAFKAEMEKQISHLWVLISGAAVSGYICFWILESEIHLLNLAIHPEQRGNRLGQLLVTRMIEKGIMEGLKNVWLEVRQSNSGARSLYNKMGFHEVGVRPNYYSETNEDAILMSLELSRDKKL
jgi:[ribosomal protein S18]-alanine N-acetyltransferase